MEKYKSQAAKYAIKNKFGNAEDIEDAMQSVSIAMLNKTIEFDKGYFYKSIVNRLYNTKKSRVARSQRENEFQTLKLGLCIENFYEDFETKKLKEMILDKGRIILTPKQYLVVSYILCGYTREEIATETKMGFESVKTHYKLALARLKKELT